MIPYANNEEIVIFFRKAQHKIAQLGKLVADEKESDSARQLLLDLSNFLESLDSPYMTWEEKDIIRFIHFWNRKAGLINIPFIQFTDYKVFINQPGTGTDIPDISGLIDEALRRFPHNNLARLQGGSTGEFYHLSKAEYDWVRCQMGQTPCPTFSPPSVSLTITPNIIPFPSGYYELGTAVTLVTLQGGILLNGGGKTKSYFYRKQGVEIPETRVLNREQVNPFVDRSSIKVDTTYTFEATFEIGDPKSDSKSIFFRQPMYYGVLTRSNITPDNAIKQSKDVRDKGYMELTFVLPEGNTTLPVGQDKTCLVFFPASWGIPSSIKVLDFEFKTDWEFTPHKMKLADNSLVDGTLGVFKNQSEGPVTFKFSF
jgi:hypothetical protein